MTREPFANYLELQAELLAPSLADEALTRLLADTPWQQPSITLFGNTYPVPRLTAWYGDLDAAYSYSGIRHRPIAWTPLLLRLKGEVEAAVGAEGFAGFNSVLLNYYRHGQDANGWHADDEPELCPNSAIASLSLGATRRFRLRLKRDKHITQSLDLAHNCLLIMRPGTQQLMSHCLAKTQRPVAGRLNLTFRRVL